MMAFQGLSEEPVSRNLKIFFLLFILLALAMPVMGQVPVTFKLGMDTLITQGLFSAASGDKVCVRGSFNQWEGFDHELKASADGNVYIGTFVINASVGDTIDYKFVIVKEGDKFFWESNPNPDNPDHGNRRFIIDSEKIELPAVYFKPDEFIRWPVFFSRKKLREDFQQFRNILETTHPALYDYTGKEVLDSIFDRNFAMIDTALEFRNFLLLMTEVISQVGCGHSSLWVPDVFWNVAPEKLFPLKLEISGGKVFVTGSYGNDPRIRNGGEILAINGMPVESVIERLSALTSADGFNRSYRTAKVGENFSVKYAVAFGFPDNFLVEYKTPGNRESIKAMLVPVSKKIVDSNKPDRSKLCFEQVENSSTAILTINTFGYYDRVGWFRNVIDSVFRVAHLQGIENLILDLRGNSGGDPFCASWLWTYLEPEPLPYFREHYGRYDTLADPLPLPRYHFEGRLFTLIDGHGFSTTGHFCGLLKYYKVGKFIGNELGSTYTCTGNATYPALNHTGIMVGTARVRRYTAAVEYMDPMRGIMPDYWVQLTQDDIINDRDPVMELALRLAFKDE